MRKKTYTNCKKIVGTIKILPIILRTIILFNIILLKNNIIFI